MKQDNPYYYTVPAQQANFVGRWSVVDEIAADLMRPRCDSWAVIGGRRFGKSSLLKAIETRLLAHLSSRQRGDRHIVPLLIDLKRCSIETEEHIYACIVRELYRALRRNRLPGIDLTQLELPELGKAKQITFAEFEDMLDRLALFVEEQRGPLRLALLLDEVEAMIHYHWSETLFNQLRALIYDGFLSNTVKLVLAGSAGFIKTQEGSPLWNAIKIKYLELLSTDALTELIAKGGALSVDVAVAIQEQSGGHPFIAQYLLHYLWDDQDALSQATVTQTMQIAQQMHQDQLDDLQGWWEAIGEDGRRVYVLLANTQGEVEDHTLLTKQLDLSQPLDRALRSLRYHGLVARSDDRQRYRIAGRLFRDWYLRNPIFIPPAPLFLPLRDLLAELYSRTEDAKRIAQDCGLNPVYIFQDAKLINYWGNILTEAHKQNKMKNLVDIAKREYPAKAEGLEHGHQVYLKNIVN
jgi:hypothetical protein